MLNQQEFQNALQLFQSGKLSQAKLIIDQCLDGSPDDINMNMLSAAISASESDFAVVVEKCSHILDIEPSNTRAAYNAAVACEKLGDYEGVIKFSTHVLKYDSNNTSTKLLLAAAFYDNKDLEKSHQICLDLITDSRNPDIISNVCRLFTLRNDTASLEKLLQDSLEIDPDNPPLLASLVSMNVSKGDYGSAKEYLDRLIQIDAGSSHTANARVTLLFSQGMYRECIDYIGSLTPEIIRNTPALLVKQAESHMAISEYTQALNILNHCISENIKAAECFHNIGIINERQGDLDSAIAAYEKSLVISPASLSTYYNLAFVLERKGQKKRAIDAILNCFEIQDSEKVRQAFVDIVSTANVDTIGKNEENIILSVLEDEVTSAQSLSRMVTALLKDRYPLINDLFERANADNFDGFLELLKDRLDELTSIPLLQPFYIKLPVTEYSFEVFTKMLRRALLLQICSIEEASDAVLDLCASIAIQCYINGYVYTLADTECSVVDGLRKKYSTSGVLDNRRDIILLSMYISLYELHKQSGIKISLGEASAVTGKLLKIQLEDNILEEEIYDSMHVQAQIVDNVSLLVQKQYEGNPYPVWQILDRREPEPISNILQSVTRHSGKVRADFGLPDILVAGCGTGSHVLQTAMRIQHQSITAIDLSKRSLAFACRKAAEYRLDHIDFRQMDILNVAELGKRFDIIESIGVLHHMKEPLTGLKRLTDVLNPDGFMCIGLYSKVARRHILRAKSIYDRPGVFVSDDEIRMARVDLMNSDDREMANGITQCKDFYALHDCRDLIFHENENNYTLDEISVMLDEAGLEFIGFDAVDHADAERYSKMFPDDTRMSDLTNWELFEERYPDTFAGMYVFWCRRKAHNKGSVI